MKKSYDEKWQKRIETTSKIIDYLWDEFPLLVAQKIASMIPKSVLNRIGIEKVDPNHVEETPVKIEGKFEMQIREVNEQVENTRNEVPVLSDDERLDKKDIYMEQVYLPEKLSKGEIILGEGIHFFYQGEMFYDKEKSKP